MLGRWTISSFVLALLCSLVQGQTTIHGAGSTFIYPIVEKWAVEYHKIHPEIQISYLPNGSGAGIALMRHSFLDRLDRLNERSVG